MELADKGVPTKIVALGHRSGAVVMVKADSPIRSMADLKGKGVAIPSRFAVDYLFVRRLLKQHGMSVADITVIEMNPPDMPAAYHAAKRAEEGIQQLAKQVVFAQEEERHRVSRELHDEAGQALTALKLGLTLIQNELPAEAEALRRKLTEAVALADVTTDRIRLLAHGLRPPALDTVGLNLTLEAFCRDFAKRTQMRIQYEGAEVSCPAP
jgi:signal transduction histidine kinase